MAMFDTPFYHKTIELYHGVFGKLFDNLKVVRSNGDVIKVPLAWSGQQKYNVRVDQNPNPDEFTIKNRLPRMSYQMIGMERDAERVTNRQQHLVDNTVDRTTATGVNIQYNRVPFNFTFALSLTTKYYEDMLCLIEQIMVYFNPEITVTIEDNPDINMSSDLVIQMDSHDLEDSFEGEFSEDRIIQKDFQFTLRGWLYMPTSSYGIIKQVTLNYYDMDFPDTQIDHDIITPDG